MGEVAENEKSGKKKNEWVTGQETDSFFFYSGQIWVGLFLGQVRVGPNRAKGVPKHDLKTE